MTTEMLAEKMGAKVAVKGETREVEGFYIGDLLSHVMGKLQENFAWLTVMNNNNVAAVASLTDCACVVLCDGVQPCEELRARAESLKLNILCTELDLFGAARKVF